MLHGCDAPIYNHSGAYRTRKCPQAMGISAASYPERWADDMRSQRVLERVGWRFWRCWASSFTIDPDGCMADLFATLERLNILPLGDSGGSTVYSEHRTATPFAGEGGIREPAQEGAPSLVKEGVGRIGKVVLPPNGVRAGDRVVTSYLMIIRPLPTP
jgi:hypothetical protein